ncbi:MAG: DUF2292 domain-containing protein [Pirellulales bacterium]
MSQNPLVAAPPQRARDPRQIDAVLEHVRQALVGLQFGEVSLVVQDGVVVQVERIERKRFRRGER